MSHTRDRRKRNRQFARGFPVAILTALGLLSLNVSASIGAPASSSDLSIAKSDSPDPVFAGTPLAYSIQVVNLGPNDAADVIVTDNLPKGTSFVSAASTQGSCVVDSKGRKVTCALGTMSVGEGPQYDSVPVTVTINVLAPPKVGKGKTITNKASVGSDSKDPKRGNNTATAITRVVEAPKVTCSGQPATIIGTPASDLLVGTAGNDVIFAGDGDDRVFTFGGTDLICAGTGSDVVRSGALPDRVFAGLGPDRVFGGGGGDVLGGARGRDLLRGGRGSDLLSGGLGRDRCFGGPGSDLFRSC